MSSTPPAPDDALRRAVLDLMADGRERSLPEIASDLDGHPALADDEALDHLVDIVQDVPGFATVDGEHIFDLDVLLSERVLTHRLTDDERKSGIIALRPDIDLVALTSRETLPVAGSGDVPIVFTADDGEVSQGFAEELAEGGGLALGSAALDALCAGGDLIAATLRDGQVHLVAVEVDPDADEAASAALRRHYDDSVDEDDGSIGLTRLVLTWLLSDRDALRSPGAPLAALVDAAGLERRGDWAGPAGGEWLTPPEIHAHAVHQRNTEVYGFDDCCHEAYAVVAAAFAGGQFDVRGVGEGLSHGEVAPAFLSTELADAGHHVPDVANDLIEFTTALLESADATAAPSALYVRATAYECLGRVAEAEADLRTALRLDGAHRRSLITAAGYLDDRGDARRALSNLRRAGLEDDHPQVRRLQRIVDAEPSKVGRNDPCPCGSGRKFKACCIDRSVLPSGVQAEWLYAKILGFALHPARRGVAEHLAVHAIERDGSDDSPEERVDDDVRLAELAAFEGGVMEWFVAERSALLPRHEQELVERWADRPLRVFDVRSAADEDAVVVDLSTGEETRVGTFSFDEIEAGTAVVARLLPIGEGWVLGGPITDVPDGEVAAAQALAGSDDATAHDWAEWIGHIDAVGDGSDGADGPFQRSDGHHHHSHH